jgi:cellulose synthase/poly-beta-1,6-N-acetylglucosamine synthase-like glycosyltransferase
MTDILQIYGILILIFWIIASVYLAVNRNRVEMLSHVKFFAQPLPAVVIIIPVRNEAENLREALQSVCNLAYPHYRVMVINDRSTDESGAILLELSTQYRNLHIVEIVQLPPAWLGKNHALFTGYNQSSEEWLLFTDADVEFRKDTLWKAMSYMQKHSLDHLTVLPHVKSRSSTLNALLGTFVMMLEFRHKPWQIRDPDSNASLGVGAFNLVKRSSYEKAGTHESFALRPDDDLKLGELMKTSGGRCDAVYGDNQISLEWYPSVQEFVKGLMKNTFAIFNYRWWFAILGGVIPVTLLYVMPVALLLTGTSGLVCYMIISAAQFVIFNTSRGVHMNWWSFLTTPISGLIMIYIVIKSTYLTLKQKGIYWRDTFYSLDELRKNI